MKTKIHPQYHSDATITCACGAVVVAGSTIKEQKTDICSQCHPFYTGKQKLVDTAGRVDKFRARMEAAKAHANKSDETTTGKKKSKDDKYVTIEDIKSYKDKEEDKAIKREATKKGKSAASIKKEKDEAKAKEDEKKAEAKAKRDAKKKEKAEEEVVVVKKAAKKKPAAKKKADKK